MSPARKPVIVRKFTRDWCAGYANAELTATSSTPFDAQGGLEMLDSGGKLLQVGWSQIKWVCFVRELATSGISGNDTVNPERLLRRKFTTRPRIDGLWLRLILSDGDELEGVAANDRSLIEGAGLLLTPPDTRSNTQRVFVPQTAIREITVLGVVGPSAERMRGSSQQRVPSETQTGLFDSASSETVQASVEEGDSVTIDP